MAKSIISRAGIEAWLESGKYLPEPLRDFHDQKEIFQAIDETIRRDPGAFIKRPSWIEAQCYVIDVFLWYMARRGYTLQRSRMRADFRDLDADVRGMTDRRNAHYAALLNDFIAQVPPPPPQGGSNAE